MKVIALFLVLAVHHVAVQAFVVAPRGCTEKQSTAVLRMGWFDKAFHGGGSANQEELDEIYRTQQAILAARRGETKEHMKQKYKEPRKFEVKATKEVHAGGDEMYVQVDKKARKKAASASKAGGAFKMPWDK
ncbi:hypothetical protein MHU86_23553 [Fragilaria crotonensis]|nr:hypothetical protein MHU86_23553 [Fragilaria crotonensis]